MSPLGAALMKLQSAEGRIAASKLTGSQQRELEQWGRSTGAVTYRSAGRGKVYYVVPGRWRALEQTLHEISPGTAADPATLHPRAVSLAKFRSTKAGQKEAHDHLLPLKPVGGGAVWLSDNGEFHITEACRHTGATLLPIRPDDDWHTSGDLWLVENQAMFDWTMWVPATTTGTVTYFAGELHSRLMAWIEARSRAARVILFPDYDANGLCNLERLAARCACPVELYLFDGWQQALKTYGCRALHRANHEDFVGVVQRLNGKARTEARPLIEAMLECGLSLEQEAAFLAPEMVNTMRDSHG